MRTSNLPVLSRPVGRARERRTRGLCPLRQGAGLKSFPVTTDELYANLRWQPEGSDHVLASAYDDHALYNGKARQPIPGDGIHQPILWTTQYGMGRVFVTTLGHSPTEVKEIGFGTTFARGAEWAATGKVTLPIPTELAAK